MLQVFRWILLLPSSMWARHRTRQEYDGDSMLLPTYQNTRRHSAGILAVSIARVKVSVCGATSVSAVSLYHNLPIRLSALRASGRVGRGGERRQEHRLK